MCGTTCLWEEAVEEEGCVVSVQYPRLVPQQELLPLGDGPYRLQQHGRASIVTCVAGGVRVCEE